MFILLYLGHYIQGEYSCLDSTFVIHRMKIRIYSPGWCGSGDRVLAWEQKGHWFDSQSGHMLGLQSRAPVGGMREATMH